MTSIVDLKKSQHNRPHQFVRYLSKKHDVTVLSINDWWKGQQDDLESYSRDFDDILEGVHYYYLTDKKVSPVLQELLFRKRAKELSKEDFDVHLNYSTLMSGYEVSKRVRTVFDIADDLVAMIRNSPQIPEILRPFSGCVGKFCLNKSIEKAQFVTVTTEALKKAYNIQDEKVKIMPNGVDINLFKNYGSAKEELGLDGFIVGYVGVLREWLDLEPVFDALKTLDKEIKMVIVGKEGRFKENLLLAERCGVLDRVIFKGMIRYPEVPKYISAMDVCVIPFKDDDISQNAVPLKLFEYMACGKPVISAELPGVKGVAADKILYASTAGEYVERIRMLYTNERLKTKLGIEGRRFVEKNYNWEGIVERVRQVLLMAATK